MIDGNAISTGYLIRFDGDPLDGKSITAVHPWPLPERVSLEDIVLPGEVIGLWRGLYVKVSQSQLTEDSPHVMRGAQYRWEHSGG